MDDLLLDGFYRIRARRATRPVTTGKKPCAGATCAPAPVNMMLFVEGVGVEEGPGRS